MSTARRGSRFRVGDHVEVDFGRRKLTGVIVEDRGALGIRGQHLFKVDIPMDPFDPLSIELPEDQIVTVSIRNQPLSADKIIEYLINGGLESILRSGVSGGRNPPGVWLCLDQLGNVTHTFVAERGVVGGQPPPFFALNGQRIFTPDRERVVEYVESFGLSRKQAEQVVAAVGTAP